MSVRTHRYLFTLQISYIVINTDLHLQINNAEKYSNIGFTYFGTINGKKQEIGSKNITDDIFFAEIIIEIPKGADSFSLKCRQNEESGKSQPLL